MEPRLRGSLDSTSSTRGYPLRRGILAAAVDRDLVSLYPVQTVYCHFDISFGCFVFGLVSFAFQSGCWAMVVRFSLLGGGAVRSCGYVGFCYGLSFGLPLTAPFQQFRMVQAPFTKYAGCKNIVKNAFVRLKLQENGYPIQSKLLTIQVIPHRLSSFPYSLSY